MERNNKDNNRGQFRPQRRRDDRGGNPRSDRPRRAQSGRRNDDDNRDDETRQHKPFRSSATSRNARPRRDSQGDEKRGSFRRGKDEERPRRDFQRGERRGSFHRDSGEERPRRQRDDADSVIKTQRASVQHDKENMVAAKPRKKDDGLIRLNKYIANAGICSRREADDLIAAGSVTVNGQVVTEMGFKVKPTDVVAYGGETLRSERKRYFLLNKPKGFITTVDDPHERQTVMTLVDSACRERIYPVGRLDRQTMGLLLFTNDGELARRLTHPSTGVYKIYHVELNKPLAHEDMQRILDGIELEDGPIHADDVQYVEGADDKRVVGVALHSGKNRIVRRIFEHLGYEIHKLDRVVFAGLTKKDLPRGRYRELTEKEVAFLKMI